jgi:hypothetical protein
VIPILLGCCRDATPVFIARSIVFGWGLIGVSTVMALMGVVAAIRSRRILAAGVLGVALVLHSGWWLAGELGCGTHLTWSLISTLMVAMLAVGPWFCSFNGRWSARNVISLVGLYAAAFAFESTLFGGRLRVGDMPELLSLGPLVSAGWSLLFSFHRRWWAALLGVPAGLWLGLTVYCEARLMVQRVTDDSAFRRPLRVGETIELALHGGQLKVDQ